MYYHALLLGKDGKDQLLAYAAEKSDLPRCMLSQGFLARAFHRGGGSFTVDGPAAAKYSSSCFAYLKEHAYQPTEDIVAPSDIIQKPYCFGTLAAFITGFLFEYGVNIPVDKTLAFKHFEVAAIQGNMFAQNEMSFLFDSKKDYSKSMQYLRLAAAQNYAAAQYNIGVYYCMGHLVTKDYREAYKFFKLAADQGLLVALFEAGQLIYYGQGVARDKELAKKILQDAAAKGSEDAKAMLHKKFENSCYIS